MKQVITNVYTFAELSESAKQKALENNARESEYFWGDDAINSLKKFAEHFNSELKNWSIDWVDQYRNEVFFNVPTFMQELTEHELKEYIESMGSYNKETLKGDGECKFTGFCMDEDAAYGARIDFYKNGETDVKELLYSGYCSLIAACKKDYEYQLSKEGFSEMCELNEYEFTENGEMF